MIGLGLQVFGGFYRIDDGDSPSVKATETFFNDTDVPMASASDGSPLTLGTTITTNVPGTITGGRFYRATGADPTHTVTLFDDSGTTLAQASTVSETDSGWQSVTFSSPVTAGAGDTFVISYYDGLGVYCNTTEYFASAITRGDLTAPANSGVFYNAGVITFPDTSYQSSCYFVDLFFVPD